VKADRQGTPPAPLTLPCPPPDAEGGGAMRRSAVFGRAATLSGFGEGGDEGGVASSGADVP